MKRNRNWIKWTVYAVAVFLVAVLQFDPFLFPKVGGGSPLLLVPAVVCVAMFEGETPGAAYGIAAGLLWDTQGGSLFGFDAFFLMLFGMFTGLLVRFLFRRDLVTSLLFTAGVSLLLELLTWFFYRNLFGDADFAFAMLRIILPTCLYTTGFCVPLYFGAKHLSGRFAQEE